MPPRRPGAAAALVSYFKSRSPKATRYTAGAWRAWDSASAGGPRPQVSGEWPFDERFPRSPGARAAATVRLARQSSSTHHAASSCIIVPRTLARMRASSNRLDIVHLQTPNQLRRVARASPRGRGATSRSLSPSQPFAGAPPHMLPLRRAATCAPPRTCERDRAAARESLRPSPLCHFRLRSSDSAYHSISRARSARMASQTRGAARACGWSRSTRPSRFLFGCSPRGRRPRCPTPCPTPRRRRCR